MGETHTSVWGGWTITVWMYSTGVWSFIATKGKEYPKRGNVEATNRTQAFWQVASLL